MTDDPLDAFLDDDLKASREQMTPEERAQFDRRMSELLQRVETNAMDRVQELGQKLKAVKEFEAMLRSNPDPASEDSHGSKNDTA